MLIYNKKKLSNLFVYLSSNIENLHLTKLIKLTYIIDEFSMTETGTPVTWLNYKVWKKGPVPEKIYFNIIHEYGSEFSEYIEAIPSKNYKNGYKIISKTIFDDSEFSDYEMELMDRVINEFGQFTSDELIDFLHKKDSLWYKMVVEKGLEEKFKYETTTPYQIPLRDAIKDQALRAIYDEMLLNVQFFNQLES